MKLYDELAEWWPLMSPPERYADEAERYLRLLQQACTRPVRSVLELGSGAGHLATCMPEELEVVLLDRSERMLEVSRRLNPERQHVRDDLRSAALGRTFDAVVLHDAVMYMTSRADLRAALHTAAEHLAPGGALLVVPDVVQETFEEGSVGTGGDDGERAVQLLEWHWDPDPADETYVVDFALLLREEGRVRAIHEQHTMGLFSRPTFWELLRAEGFEPVEADPLDSAEVGEVFLVRRR